MALGEARLTRVPPSHRSGSPDRSATRGRGRSPAAPAAPIIPGAMCGRFVLSSPLAELQRAFRFAGRPNLAPRFNVAPTQQVAIVRLARDGTGRRELTLARWGLVPAWAKDPAVGNRMINARAEGIAGKPAFRAAFRQRRALVPADGF